MPDVTVETNRLPSPDPDLSDRYVGWEDCGFPGYMTMPLWQLVHRIFTSIKGYFVGKQSLFGPPNPSPPPRRRPGPADTTGPGLLRGRDAVVHIGDEKAEIEDWEFGNTRVRQDSIDVSEFGDPVQRYEGESLFVYDPDTGIGSTAADQLSLIVGGAERLRLDPSGNVGNGVTNPEHNISYSGNFSTPPDEMRRLLEAADLIPAVPVEPEPIVNNEIPDEPLERLIDLPGGEDNDD